MKIALTEALDRDVREQVDAGLYEEAAAVIRDALGLEMRIERTEQEKLEALRRDINAAWEAERGGIRGLRFGSRAGVLMHPLIQSADPRPIGRGHSPLLLRGGEGVGG